MQGLSFAFNGGQGGYEDLKRRQLFGQLMQQRGSRAKPQNYWEGVNSATSSIFGALIANKYGNLAAKQKRLDELPHYRRGTNFHPGGMAVVGEDGPEVVNLPRGAQVQPNPNTVWEQEFKSLTPEEQDAVRKRMLEGLTPQEAIQPSGVGEESQLNSAARSFQGFMKSLDDYEKTFNDGGSTMWPGARKDELGIAHRDLQMQMKELYNLGVLNGPDLDLMNQILIDPTTVGGNVLDVLGGDRDMEKRIPANIAQVRELMLNRTTPALQQIGIDPQRLMPAQNRDLGAMSDEDLLKALMGGG